MAIDRRVQRIGGSTAQRPLLERAKTQAILPTRTEKRAISQPYEHVRGRHNGLCEPFSSPALRAVCCCLFFFLFFLLSFFLPHRPRLPLVAVNVEAPRANSKWRSRRAWKAELWNYQQTPFPLECRCGWSCRMLGGVHNAGTGHVPFGSPHAFQKL